MGGLCDSPLRTESLSRGIPAGKENLEDHGVRVAEELEIEDRVTREELR